MFGAIFGDIAGSRFEFDRGGKTKEFELFTKECAFTDDTVMTVAVGEALLAAGREAGEERIREEVIKSMKAWGRRYPDAGYGSRFGGWLFTEETAPYGSYGNGSAMRVSAAGWLYGTLEETGKAAGVTAEVTHSHPEGVKGAVCTAAVMFLSRTGCTKDKIRRYVTEEFGYDLTETLEEMRQRHCHVETCMDSMPKALKSFLEGTSYEDVVRNAVSLGGDTDTIAAIAGAMGEAYFGIPKPLMEKGLAFLPEDMKKVLVRFENALKEGKTEK